MCYMGTITIMVFSEEGSSVLSHGMLPEYSPDRESSSQPVGVNEVRCKEVLNGVLSVPEVSSGVRIMSICHVHAVGDVGISTGQYGQPQRQQGTSWKSRCCSLTARVQQCGSYQILQHNETTYLNTSTEI